MITVCFRVSLSTLLFFGTFTALEADFVYTGQTESPFIEHHARSVQTTPSASAPVELRGVVKEDGSIWLTFFDPTAKKWTTMREGESDESLVVRSFDQTTEVADIEIQNQRWRVALVGNAPQSFGRTSVASAVSTPFEDQQKSFVPPPSGPETARFEAVASMVRQRIEQQKLAKETKSADS